MSASRKRRLVTIGSVILILAILIVAWQVLFAGNRGSNRAHWPDQFRSNGEQIYFTATNAAGQALRSQSGGRGMGMGMMGSGGCVTCHGADRKGSRMMPRFWLAAPPLTSDALFGEHDEGSGNDGHGDHDSYTEETLKRAITRGIDAGGNTLDPIMPRWAISGQDLDDLISYLKGPGTIPD